MMLTDILEKGETNNLSKEPLLHFVMSVNMKHWHGTL